MTTVDAHNARYFFCPRCELRTFLREKFVTVGEIPARVLAEPAVCKHCDYKLTRVESGLLRDGGAMGQAWQVTCPWCGRDNFLSITIYEESGERCSGRPPSSAGCKNCRRAYLLGLVDP
jgi:hypothetical protein